jgi:hypothetical protein
MTLRILKILLLRRCVRPDCRDEKHRAQRGLARQRFREVLKS